MTAATKRQKREEYRKTHKEEGRNTELPKKKFYRQRAHANPFSDHDLTYPVSPSQMDWSKYYPAYVDHNAPPAEEGQPTQLTKQVTVADIGCGFGGLLVALSPMLPDELILGLEIRAQVTEYVQDRIFALRSQHAPQTGEKKIVFSSHTVENDSYIQLPTARSSNAIGTKEYLIQSKSNIDAPTITSTEAQLKEILQITHIPSYQNTGSTHTHWHGWHAHLTASQATAIQDLDNTYSVEENVLSNEGTADGQSPTYYNPHTLTLTPHPPRTPYSNIAVLRANTMKFLPNFFTRSQLTHIFLCFPDPHFKARKHKARIVSSTLCAEYAYVLKPGGCVYTITDVEELGNWMWERFQEFGKGGDGVGIFEAVDVPGEGEERAWMEGGGGRGEVARVVRCIREETEEGKKVSRNGGRKFVGVWRRREDPKWPDEEG